MPGLARFRVNVYRQRGSWAAVIRVVMFSIPDWEAIGIPKQVTELSDRTGGMVLVTGTAGCGKSTTLACLVDRINHNRACHIVTLGDPIEYLHRNEKSIVSQREIAVDTNDYLSALRACLRQAPDVNGEQIPAFEVLQMTGAVRSMIRDSKNHLISGAIASGAAEGMLCMDQSILNLYQAGRITRQTALAYADNAEQMLRRIG